MSSETLRIAGLVLVIALATFLLLNLQNAAADGSLWIAIPVLIIGFIGVVLLKRVGRK